jgi:hypothetical protein
VKPILALVALVALGASARAQEDESAEPNPYEVPPPPSDDPKRLVTASGEFTIGNGDDPQVVLEGPFVLTALSSDCPAVFRVVGAGAPATLTSSFTRLLIPAGAQLVVDGAYGLCIGSILVSGFVP